MARFHVNPETGQAGECRAARACPFGGEEAHFASSEEARHAYESQMSTAVVPERLSASEEGARRGQLLLSGLDAAYQAEKRRATEAKVDVFEAEVEAISKSLKWGDEAPETGGPTTDPAFRAEWRKSMVDTLEDRRGERHQPDALVRVETPDGVVELRADELHRVFPVGSWTGEAYNPRLGEREKVDVAVYGDGSSRAFMQDLRANDEFRHRLLDEKREELMRLESYFVRQVTDSDDAEVAAVYRSASSLVSQASRTADWSRPEGIVPALDHLEEVSDEFDSKAEDEPREELKAAYQDVEARLYTAATDNTYYLAGLPKSES